MVGHQVLVLRIGVRVPAPEPFDKLMALPYSLYMWYVYILLCNQKIFYVGSTNDLKRRINQHRKGESKYTKKFSDIKFIYYESLPSEKAARSRESQIKRWSVAKKKALIKGNKDELRRLSKSHGFVE